MSYTLKKKDAQSVLDSDVIQEQIWVQIIHDFFCFYSLEVL